MVSTLALQDYTVELPYNSGSQPV